MNNSCSHPNMESTARIDYCPDCGYQFYYGDAHAIGEAQKSKLVNPGKDGYAYYDEYGKSADQK